MNFKKLILLFLSLFFISCSDSGTTAFTQADSNDNNNDTQQIDTNDDETNDNNNDENKTEDNITTIIPVETNESNSTVNEDINETDKVNNNNTDDQQETTDEQDVDETDEVDSGSEDTQQEEQDNDDGISEQNVTSDEVALILDDSSNTRLKLKQEETLNIYLSVQNSDLIESNLNLTVDESVSSILAPILIEKVSNARYKVTLEGLNLGETVLTFKIEDNSTLQRQMLVTVVNPASSSYILEVCPDLNIDDKTLISDLNNDNGSPTENSAIILNSRVTTVQDYEKTRVSIFYQTFNSYLDLVEQTIFLKNSEGSLVATLNYSETLLGTDFYIIYVNQTTETEECLTSNNFPESVENAEELTIELGDINSQPF
jgi:hypothetical protein